ncbi:hypothetical protein Bhyg_06340 [Pseudolycoriella hygida]|uniref:Uncharacterized protein n=1 Tax=Pseudolycoriella hygida TaxID=35572 RepID=A0A9Q0N165_9DIPT|nr:hypothetical protein Bhyg_06340 [Pseudolycoriella hygida]
MNFACLCLLFLQICLVKSEILNSAELLQKCKNEVDASEEDVKMIIERKMPTSYGGLCLLACLYENSGIIQNGKFVIENLNKAIETGAVAIGGKVAKQYINEINQDCKDIENDDKCVLAKEIIMCAAESITRNLNLNKEL